MEMDQNLQFYLQYLLVSKSSAGIRVDIHVTGLLSMYNNLLFTAPQSLSIKYSQVGIVVMLHGLIILEHF